MIRISNKDFNAYYKKLKSTSTRSLAVDEIRLLLSNANLPFELDLLRNEKEGTTFLHKAALEGEVDFINFLTLLVNIDATNDSGYTSLLTAILSKHPQSVSALLHAGANPNLSSDEQNFTPLQHCIQHAAFAEDTEHKKIWNNVAIAIIQRGADINQQSKQEGYTALHQALYTRNLPVLIALIDTHEANLALKDTNGNTSLHVLATFPFNKGNNINESVERDITEYFLSHVDRLDYKNTGGKTVLHLCVICNNVFLFTFFIQNDFWFKQANLLTVQDNEGRTVIHLAIYLQRIEILRLLLSISTASDLKIKDHASRTPLQLVEHFSLEIENFNKQLIDINEYIKKVDFHRAKLTKEYWVMVGWRKELATEINIFENPKFIKTKTYFILGISYLKDNLDSLGETLNKLSSYQISDRKFLSTYKSLIMKNQLDLNKITNNFNRALSSNDIKKVETAFFLLYKHLKFPITTLLFQLRNEINAYQVTVNSYHENLHTIEKILKNEDFIAWKHQQLLLESSFPDYIESLQQRKNFFGFLSTADTLEDSFHQQAKNNYLKAQRWLKIGNEKNAIEELENAIVMESACSQKNEFIIAKFRFKLSELYFNQNDLERSKYLMQEVITTLSSSTELLILEKAYLQLAKIAIISNNYIPFEQEHLTILYTSINSLHDKKMSAHLSLAGLYKLIPLYFTNLLNDELTLKFKIFASYHYSEAYKFSQGPIDPEAQIVLQREMGVTHNEKIGTYNIQQCVVVIAHHEETGKVVLAHFDKFSGPINFFKKLLSQFSETDEIATYLTGGRDRRPFFKDISENNIDLVLKQLYQYRNRFKIKSADLGDKLSPAAIVFDPISSPTRLLHKMPDCPRDNLNERAITMLLQLSKEYTRPPNFIDFSETEHRIDKFELSEINQNYQKNLEIINRAPEDYPLDTWNNNQIIYPLLQKIHNFNPTESILSQPLLLRLGADLIPVSPTSAITFSSIESLFFQQGLINLDITQLSHTHEVRKKWFITQDDFKHLQHQPTPLEISVNKKKYQYWLEERDIFEVSKIMFSSFVNKSLRGKFLVIKNEDQNLRKIFFYFQDHVLTTAFDQERLTVLVRHSLEYWATLVIDYQNHQFTAYYVSPNQEENKILFRKVFIPLSELNINVVELPSEIHYIDCNSALIALKHAQRINNLIDFNDNFDVRHWMLEQQTITLDDSRDYFKAFRKNFAQLANLKRKEMHSKIINTKISSCVSARKKRSPSCKLFTSLVIDDHEFFSSRNKGIDKESLSLIVLATSWKKALGPLMSLIQSDWIPILASAKKIDKHNEKLTLIHRYTQIQREETLSGISSWRFLKKLKVFFERMKRLPRVTRFIITNPEQAFRILFKPSETDQNFKIRSGLGNTDAPSTLNLAFVLKTLFSYFQATNHQQPLIKQEALSLAFETHLYINMMQMVHGIALDADKTLSLVQTLLQQENLLQKPISIFMQPFKFFIFETLGSLLQMANIGLDVYELSQVHSEAKINLYATQLTFDTSNLMLAGASTLSEMIGLGATEVEMSVFIVPLIGLQIGTLGLVNSFNTIIARAKAVGKFVNELDDAYSNHGYQLNDQHVMVPRAGAVIKGIDFIENIIQFDSQFIYRSVRQTHGFNMPICLRNKTLAINIRKGLGHTENYNFPLAWKMSTKWILPIATIRYFSYSWQILPFATSRHDREFDAIKKLEGENLFHSFYHFPSEYIIDQLFEDNYSEVSDTAIKIVLDDKNRVFFIPKITVNTHLNLPHWYYIFEARSDKGSCLIVLDPVKSIEIHSISNYIWILSAKNLENDTVIFESNAIQINNIKIKILNPQTDCYFYIDKNNNYFLLDFIHHKTVIQSLDYRFVEHQSNDIQRYLNQQRYNPSHIIPISNYPLLDDNNETYFGKAFYKVIDNKYLFMQSVPQSIGKESTGITISENYTFFYHPKKTAIWRTNENNYVDKQYSLFDSFKTDIISNFLNMEISSIVLHPSNAINIIQKVSFENVSINLTKEEGYLFYQLKIVEDKLMLNGLQNFSINFIQNQLLRQKKPLLKALRCSKLNDQLLGKYSISAPNLKIAELANTISSNYLNSENNITFSIFLSKNIETQNYNLLEPRIYQQITYLGSLTDNEQKKIYYYFEPQRANKTACLFQQHSADTKAHPLNIMIAYPLAISSNYLYFLSTQGFVEAIDYIGNSYLIHITNDWLIRNQNWTLEIPDYLSKHPTIISAIPISGIKNNKNQLIKTWYDTKKKQFIYANYLESNNNDTKNNLDYLGEFNEILYFFSYSQKTLFKQTITPTLNLNGTQLLTPLSEFILVETNISGAYIYDQKIFINTIFGLLFSSHQNNSIWELLKINYQWIQNNPNCLQEHVRFLTQISQNLTLCTSNNFIFNQFPSCENCTQNNYMINMRNIIYIEEQANTTTLFWLPWKESFYKVPRHKDGSNWIYLGTENNHDAAYFFSSDEALIYQISNNFSSVSYQTTPARFAERIINTLIFLIDLNQRNFTIPAIEKIKHLSVCIFSKQGFRLIFDKVALNYYQSISYKISSNSEENFLNIHDPENKYFAVKQGLDILITNTNNTAHITLNHAMNIENPFKFTTINLMHLNDDGKTEIFSQILLEIRSQLMGSPNYKDNESWFVPIAPFQWLENSVFTNVPVPVDEQTEPQSLISKITSKSNFFSKTVLIILASFSGITISTSIFLCSQYTRKTRYHSVPQSTLTTLVIQLGTSLTLLQGATGKLASKKELEFYDSRGFYDINDCIAVQYNKNWFGLCQNSLSILVWWKNITSPQLNWYTAYSTEMPVKKIVNDFFLIEDNLYVHFANATQHLSLKNIPGTNLEKIYPYLTKKTQTLLTSSLIYQKFYQSFIHTILFHLLNHIILHTPCGDFFKKIGLNLDWKRHDNDFFSRRLFHTANQFYYMPLNFMNFSQNFGAISIEVGLLHPKVQYYLTHYGSAKRIYRPKQIIRILADLLQFGFELSYLLPNLITILCPEHPIIFSISFALSQILTFIAEDKNYWYLGLGLYLIHFLPTLLESIGIPVTRSINYLLAKISHLFMLQTLLENINLPPDLNRNVQSENILQIADQRVDNALHRGFSIYNGISHFFKTKLKNTRRDDFTTKLMLTHH